MHSAVCFSLFYCNKIWLKVIYSHSISFFRNLSKSKLNSVYLEEIIFFMSKEEKNSRLLIHMNSKTELTKLSFQPKVIRLLIL